MGLCTNIINQKPFVKYAQTKSLSVWLKGFLLGARACALTLSLFINYRLGDCGCAAVCHQGVFCLFFAACIPK